MLEMREQCPRLARIWFDDPRGLRNYAEPGLRALDALIAAGQRTRAHPRLFDAEVAKATAATTWPRCSSPRARPAIRRAWCTRTRTLHRPRPAGARFDKLTAGEEVLAYLPPAWIGQNIFCYAQWLACGYVVNCPESASTVMIDLKEIGPTYYFAPPRIFEGLLTR